MSRNELKHYGVLGMKWGVRRYQNKDGKLTASGRKRYAKTGHVSAQNNRPRANKPIKVDKKKAAIIGATATVAALSAIGGVYLYKTGALSAAGRRAMTIDELKKMGIKVTELNYIELNTIQPSRIQI